MRPLPQLYGILIIMLLFCGTVSATQITSQQKTIQQATESLSSSDIAKEKQRTQYKNALRYLKSGQMKSYYASKQSLHNYPLKPYLDYNEIKRKLRHLPYKRVDAFLNENQDEYLANQLRKRWLNTLAKQRLWNKYLLYWDTTISSTRLQCYHLLALYHTGNKTQALEQTTKLWLKGNSRPTSCDPLFNHWLHSEHSQPDLVWQRLDLAIKAGNLSLARYLRKQLPKSMQKTAGQYIQLHRKPERLTLKKIASLPENQRSNIIAHTLKRLAYRKPQKARELFHASQQQWQLTDKQQQLITHAITVGYQRQSPRQALSWLIQFDPNGDNTKLLEWRIRLALAQNQWQSVYQWILLLPEEQQQSNRWLYWRAKAQQRIGLQPIQLQWQSDAILANLATNRDYYGFLAADLLNIDYQMQDAPLDISQETYHSIETMPGFQRAVELFAVGDVTSARNEWRYASNTIPKEHLTAAAKLAEQLQLHNTAIRSMIKAKAWNNLSIRFPLAYEQNINGTATKEDIDINWLYAIARQESAFAADAKSSAGALGLLQIMPRTAKQTAKSLGIGYSRHKLLRPATNIKLGGHYLGSLYRKFDGNRVLATAAYNAGPHRVRQWLAKHEQTLETDVWVESIPFKETRHYVQNVLAFSVIYAYRRNEESQLVLLNENNIVFN